jgi:hypothetical protein
MAGYPPAGMAWGGYAHPAVQQLPQRPQALPIEALGLGIGSRIEVGYNWCSRAARMRPCRHGQVCWRPAVGKLSGRRDGADALCTTARATPSNLMIFCSGAMGHCTG